MAKKLGSAVGWKVIREGRNRGSDCWLVSRELPWAGGLTAKTGTWLKEPGFSCGLENHQRRQEQRWWRKLVSAAGWKIRNCHKLELSSVLAGTVSEIGIGCSCERSPWRTDLAVILTHIYFRQDQNCEWMGSLQVRRVCTRPRAGTWLPHR